MPLATLFLFSFYIIKYKFYYIKFNLFCITLYSVWYSCFIFSLSFCLLFCFILFYPIFLFCCVIIMKPPVSLCWQNQWCCLLSFLARLWRSLYTWHHGGCRLGPKASGCSSVRFPSTGPVWSVLERSAAVRGSVSQQTLMTTSSTTSGKSESSSSSSSVRHILFCFHILYYSLLCTLQVLCGHKKGELPRAAACQEGFRQCQADLPTARSHHLPAAHHGAGQPSALWPQLLHQRNIHQRLTEAGERGSASRCWHLAEHGAWSGLSLAAVYFLKIVLLLSLLVFMMCVLQESFWRTSLCAKSCLSPLGLRTMWYAWGCMTPTNICFASPSASFCGRRGHWRSWFLPPTGSSTKLVMFSFSLTKNYSFVFFTRKTSMQSLLY